MEKAARIQVRPVWLYIYISIPSSFIILKSPDYFKINSNYNSNNNKSIYFSIKMNFSRKKKLEFDPYLVLDVNRKTDWNLKERNKKTILS